MATPPPSLTLATPALAMSGMDGTRFMRWSARIESLILHMDLICLPFWHRIVRLYIFHVLAYMFEGKKPRMWSQRGKPHTASAKREGISHAEAQRRREEKRREEKRREEKRHRRALR